MQAEIQVTPRQMALLAQSQQRTTDLFAMIVAGSEVKGATMIALDTDRSVVIVETPEPAECPVEVL